jgi:nucleoside-diphosphate-sugar epimerase
MEGRDRGYDLFPGEPTTVAVLGGSGFIGSHLVLNLLHLGYRLRLLINSTNPDLVSPTGRIETIRGSIEDEQALKNCFTGCHIVYHLVGLIAETRTKTFQKTVVEGTGHVVAAAHASGVRKIIYLSALGAGPDQPSRYYRTKYAAERAVTASGLDYTIFRPSIVFGPEDKFFNMLAGMIRRSPVVPVIGDGRYRLQPVYIEELCTVMARASREAVTSGRVYEIGGPEPLTYLEILDIIKRVLNKKRMTIHVPVWMARWGARMMESLLKPAPLTVDQIAMLTAGSICDPTKVEKELGVKFSPLEQQLRTYMGKR